MTETIQEQKFMLDETAGVSNTPYISFAQVKEKVLNYLFRNICFFTGDDNNNKERIKVLTSADYQKISTALKIPIFSIHKIVSRFLIDLYYFRKFFKQVLLNSKLHTHIRKLRSQLHKIYRLAPIFDYRRARENAHRLEQKLQQINRWPHIITQLAVVIFITDLLDKSKTNPIIQANLRALCNCSAYAFHGTRNRLRLHRNSIK